MNSLKLPPKKDGTRESIEDSLRQLIIIGANGAGKTRFTEYLISELSPRAFKISAMVALYDNRTIDTLPGSIDNIYSERSVATNTHQPDNITQYERLMSLLLQDEMLNLFAYKVTLSSDPKSKLPRTYLDSVIDVWQEIFPDNRVLVEGGKLLFSRTLDKDKYSSVRLSVGEKTVMYYIGAVLYAMENAVIFIDNPGIFLHPSIMVQLWNRLEQLRPDCTFIYTTHDLDFASSRNSDNVVWVREYDAATITWDYDILPPHSGLSDDIYLAIIGSRHPVLFIEGDDIHSIDGKLYPLVFPEYTVKSLGSCNKVIEATRAFNDLKAFHHLDSYGIVDRDRRDAHEVQYLREKKIFVPDVAEIENILMLEGVVRTVAHHNRKDENRVFSKVKKAIIDFFNHEIHQQAMLHTRHRVKRTVEYRIDGKFNNINMLEEHLNDLVKEINPRGLYDNFCRDFHQYVDEHDYQSILRVFNRKTMIQASNVAQLCGVNGKDGYIKAIIDILKENKEDASRMRDAIIRCFGLEDTNHPID